MAPVTHADLVQRVRAHPPSQMLRALGQLGAQVGDGGPLQPESSGPWPWVIAGLARESLAHGNEHRQSRWRPDTLARLHNGYMNLSDPYLEGGTDLDSFLLRTVHPQWDYRSAWFPALARFMTLFGRPFAADRYPVLSTDMLRSALGTDPLQFFNVTMLLMTSARHNNGVFDERVLEMDFWDQCPPGLTPDVTAQVLRHCFTQPLADAQAKARQGRHQDPRLRQYDWNPLFDRPFTEISPGLHQAVLPQHVALKASPASVYYAAGRVLAGNRWNDFTNDFGKLVEDYVGEQLAQVPRASLHGEVEYASGQRTIDWFFTVGSTTVLVECKSARIGPAARYEHSEYVAAADRAIGRALRQVKRTAQLVADSHAGLGAVSVGTTVVSWIVTAEPHHFANHRSVRDHLEDPGLPTAVLDLELLEHAIGVMLMSDPETLIHSMMLPTEAKVADPERAVMELGGELATQTPDGAMPPNPLLQAAWDANPWPGGAA